MSQLGQTQTPTRSARTVLPSNAEAAQRPRPSVTPLEKALKGYGHFLPERQSPRGAIPAMQEKSAPDHMIQDGLLTASLLRAPVGAEPAQCAAALPLQPEQRRLRPARRGAPASKAAARWSRSYNSDSRSSFYRRDQERIAGIGFETPLRAGPRPKIDYIKQMVSLINKNVKWRFTSPVLI
jgi:hypothetical protein